MRDRCTWILSRNDQPKRFTSRDQEQIVADVIEPMASDGLRTICLAYKDYVPGIGCFCCQEIYGKSTTICDFLLITVTVAV